MFACGRDNLDGDVAAEHEVAREVHVTHAPGAREAGDAIMPEFDAVDARMHDRRTSCLYDDRRSIQPWRAAGSAAFPAAIGYHVKSGLFCWCAVRTGPCYLDFRGFSSRLEAGAAVNLIPELL